MASSLAQVCLLVSPAPAVPSGLPRRTLDDSLQSTLWPTYLVTRNKHRHPLDSRQVPPSVDLRAFLNTVREDRITAGWTCTDIGRATGFFFAELEGERLQVSIEAYDPAGPAPLGHGDPTPK